MKPQFIATLLLSCFVGHRAVAQQSDGYKRVEGVYKIYGGGLGDQTEPTAKDKKIMFSLDGSTAKDIFNAIGPDRKDLCTEGTGTRVRKKDNEKLLCMKTKEGEYSCNFGFDLVTGKSIGGIIC